MILLNPLQVWQSRKKDKKKDSLSKLVRIKVEGIYENKLKINELKYQTIIFSKATYEPVILTYKLLKWLVKHLLK